MSKMRDQPDLFTAQTDGRDAQANAARARMREMIARLAAATAPPWKDQMSAILDDGAFQRAMRLVPDEEANLLWAEFDAHMERLYAIWSASDPAGKD